ncbi:3'-5' RNA helicase YTHDC2-like [Anneissia japonica]|uniref:3'-5' RNA helicase YTHDC2-like n=1 Tax=Anneissia japonica TaxID=1529436 RepID=UPI0014256EF9|nr:3'-5' RNA helicase YTHDC2-like [Anneissia japonica]
MSRQNRKGEGWRKKTICVEEQLKIGVGAAVEEFRYDETKTVLEFPSSLTSTERAYIHRLAEELGLKSKSKGKGSNRFLSLFKKELTSTPGSVSVFQFSRESHQECHNLLQRFPVTVREKQDLLPRTERGRLSGENGQHFREVNKTTGRLNSTVPQVPTKRSTSDLDAFRQTLPVFSKKADILAAIENSQVMLIAGDTGSGKTTQVPQYILDNHHAASRNCRIICTQPRRLSALSVAERVAAERGEKIGQTVGYQIRLESRTSPRTLLTFCTNGVLLRTLMGGSNLLKSVTHIIVDEIHERDRFSDFLLISLRDLLVKYRNVKLILMSAALDINLFVKYFSSCPVIQVPGNLFPVEQLFLEDALKCTGYVNDKMKVHQKEAARLKKQQNQLEQWLKEDTEEVDVKPLIIGEVPGIVDPTASVNADGLSDWLRQDMDQAISNCWLVGDEDSFTHLFHLLLSENVSVDYSHSGTSATPLMVAAGRGHNDAVERLLNIGANVNIRASNDITALDWAKRMGQAEVIETIEAHIAAIQSTCNTGADLVKQSDDISLEDKELLEAYHHSFDDEKVDIDLILSLLHYIIKNSQEGSILVFLPGYSDIVSLRDWLLSDSTTFGNSDRFYIYTLHSNMQSSDQKKVFRIAPQGIRKIILSTNIAETSVTISDVVFVIDSGKVKEKCFDSITSVSALKSNWISKSSAIQRKGRAGRCRPGMCFHLLSRVRFKTLHEFQTPELLRVPLHELCLHTKMLAPMNTPIADFLCKAPEPPNFLTIKNSIQLLKDVDAMDNWEDLTELGHHLADLPIEPTLGKMVLYSIVFKCLDPILTIVCSLAYRDPFILPMNPSNKRAAQSIRKKYSANTFSDHMSYLRVFQAWQRAKSDGWDKQFCERNFLSQATMDMIVGMRTQLLGQLRASGFVRARGPGDIRDLNANSENWAVVKAALCAGMYPNIIRVNRDRMIMTTQRESKVRFHPSCTLVDPTGAKNRSAQEREIIHSLPTDWLMYEELTRVNHLTSVRCLTLMTPITVALFAGPARLPHDAFVVAEENLIQQYCGQAGGGAASSSEGEEDTEDTTKSLIKMDNWISLKADPVAASLTFRLRQKWHSLFIRRMRAPAKPWSQADEAVLRSVIQVLSNEEQMAGLQQPVGIGQRPKPMAADSMNSPPARNINSRFGTQDYGQKNMTPPRDNRRDFRPKHDTGRWTSPKFPSSDPSNFHNNSRVKVASSPTPGQTAFTRWDPVPDAAAVLPAAKQGGGAEGGMKYFIMKAPHDKYFDASLDDGEWTVTGANEKKLNAAYSTCRAVYLVFLSHNTGNFQGYAKMISDTTSNPKGGSSFKVKWIKRSSMPYKQIQHLVNPWNENKKLQVSRDGQEIEPSVGEALLKVWTNVPACPGADDESPGSRPAFKTHVEPKFTGQAIHSPDSRKFTPQWHHSGNSPHRGKMSPGGKRGHGRHQYHHSHGSPNRGRSSPGRGDYYPMTPFYPSGCAASNDY